ncbi:MAG TPA: hypothetical protein VMU50_05625 [Polyangia bacterium]|nr:hypothetical protein [Polyangia bacterium]
MTGARDGVELLVGGGGSPPDDDATFDGIVMRTMPPTTMVAALATPNPIAHRLAFLPLVSIA